MYGWSGSNSIDRVSNPDAHEYESFIIDSYDSYRGRILVILVHVVARTVRLRANEESLRRQFLFSKDEDCWLGIYA
jgi:hypothetical protein